MLMKLHEKPYSPSPAISWKAKKKKKSKCHLSIKLLAEKDTIFGITEKFKQELFSN